jgi:hypothetical protein
MNGRGSALPFCFSAKTASYQRNASARNLVGSYQVIASALNMCGLYQRIA